MPVIARFYGLVIKMSFSQSENVENLRIAIPKSTSQ